MRQPLDNKFECLHIARVTIKRDFGCITTKAATKPTELAQDYYLLGNKTAKLIEKIKIKGKEISINMIITWSSNESLKKKMVQWVGKKEILSSKQAKLEAQPDLTE